MKSTTISVASSTTAEWADGTAVAASLAGALVGARDGSRAVSGVDRDHLPHVDRALGVAHRLADIAVAALPASEAISHTG